MTDETANRASLLQSLLTQKLVAAATPDPELACCHGGFLARPLVPSADLDAAFVVAVMRRARRFRLLGLAEPPNHDCFERETAYLWPSPRPAQLSGSLVFLGPNPVAIAVDAGLSSDLDRTRLVALLKVAKLPLSETQTQALWLALFGALKARRVHRVLVPCPKTPSDNALDPEHFGPLLPTGVPGVTQRAVGALPVWELPLAKLGVDARPSLEELKNSTVRPSDLIHIQRPKTAPETALSHRAAAPDPEVVQRNPAFAHLQLALGRSPVRALRFPEVAEESRDLVVIGAGVSGATAAYLARHRDVVVLDRDDRMGGTGAFNTAADGQIYPLAAHYECDLASNYGSELLDFYKECGFIREQPDGAVYPFVDQQYYVNSARSEQAILADGRLRTRGWRLFSTDPTAIKFRDLVIPQLAAFPLPSRNSPAHVQELAQRRFADWLAEHGLGGEGELRRSLEVLLRSDYGGLSRDINAYAGLHYFACRPYFTTGTRTFSPPQGLAYFVGRILARAPTVPVRLNQMVVRLTDRGDHMEVIALDLVAKQTRRYRAKAVIYAAPKKPIPYLFSPDRGLFARNRYAAWMTLSFEFRRPLPEAELLYWANHVAEPSGAHVGFTWANHHVPEAPPIVTAYIALRPGRVSHLRTLWSLPGPTIRWSLGLLAQLLGRDVTHEVGRVVVQKLGHAMPTPVPGSLFTDPNGHRRCERLLYAGVDTGRLPLLTEAIDSAQQAVRLLP